MSQWRRTLEIPSQTDLYFERELIEDASKIRSVCRLCGVCIITTYLEGMHSKEREHYDLRHPIPA